MRKNRWLRVDAATPFVLHVVVPLVNGYRSRYPHVELELNSNDEIIDLLERRTDVAIRIGRLKDSTLHSRAIGSSRVRLLASPEYLDAHGLRGVSTTSASTRSSASTSRNRWISGRCSRGTASRTGSRRR